MVRYLVEESTVYLRWLDSLPDFRVRAAIVGRVGRLAKGSWGDSRPVGGGVTELRIHLGSGWRVYVTERSGRIIVILGGGSKRRQAVDIAAAQASAKEID